MGWASYLIWAGQAIYLSRAISKVGLHHGMVLVIDGSIYTEINLYGIKIKKCSVLLEIWYQTYLRHADFKSEVYFSRL